MSNTIRDAVGVDYPVDSDNVTRGVMPDDALGALFAAVAATEAGESINVLG